MNAALPAYTLNPLRRTIREEQGFPVLPGAFPVVGHLPALHANMLTLIQRARREVGPMFWLELGFGVRQLTCTEPEVFEIFKNKVTSSEHFQEIQGDFLGSSLLVHDGKTHQHMRSAMNGPFTPKGLTAGEVGPILGAMISERVASFTLKGEVTVLKETRELALELIFRMMGIEDKDLSEWRHQYEEFVLTAVNVPVDLPGFPKWRGRRAQKWLDAKLLELAREAREKPAQKGLLSQLVHARDEGGLALTETELLDNLRLLALAGHETTATTMAWMVFELAQRPDLWRALCDEAAKGEVPLSPKELKSYPFAEAVFREALRLHPPVGFDNRRVKGELTLMGKRVPLGCYVGVSLTQLSRHPDLYDSPDEFRPERWLNRTQHVTPLETSQFGGGPHFCLGYHVAWMEAVQFGVALAKTMGAKGKAPRLVGGYPSTRFIPLSHPDPKARVRFV